MKKIPLKAHFQATVPMISADGAGEAASSALA
jgi:hypothetical protein